MTKVKDKLTREKALLEIYTTLDILEEAFLEMGDQFAAYPDTWINSVNKNFSAFLGYCQGITEKFNKEIKQEKKKTHLIEKK